MLQFGFVCGNELQGVDVVERVGSAGIVFQACCAQELFGILKIGFKILFVVCGETVTRFQIIGIAELSPEQAAGVRQIIYKTI